MYLFLLHESPVPHIHAGGVVLTLVGTMVLTLGLAAYILIRRLRARLADQASRSRTNP